MSEKKVDQIVSKIFADRDEFEHISKNDDFFDLGVSSLTIVRIQILVEEALDVEVPTSELIRLSTVNEWIDIYSRKVCETSADSN